MTLPEIVSVPMAREHLSLPPEQNTADLQLKIDAATQLVCEYIADRNPADEDWIAEIEGWTLGSPEAPAIIKMAVLMQVGEFYAFRGDHLASDRPAQLGHGHLSPLVTMLLHRYRSPSLA